MRCQDENLQLRTQLQELEKRVSDLTATNEFLLDQNAQLRMGVKQVAPWYYLPSAQYYYYFIITARADDPRLGVCVGYDGSVPRVGVRPRSSLLRQLLLLGVAAR